MAEAFRKEVHHALSETPFEKLLEATARLRTQFPSSPCFVVLRQAQKEQGALLRVLYAGSGPELATALEELDAEETISIVRTDALPENALALPKEELHKLLRQRHSATNNPGIERVLVQAIEPQ